MCAEPIGMARFFQVQNIAVIGASERGLYPAGILQNLIQFEFPGKIFPVNPKYESVFGLDCYPNLNQIPVQVEVAIIVVNRDRVFDLVQQCIDANVKAILIISAGFAESDPQGEKIQEELRALIAASDVAVLGPNCAGYADLSGGLIATRLPGACLQGGMSFISQSGALMMALFGVFCDEQIGMNKLISVGNQMDLDLGDGLIYLAQDKSTQVIGSFIEGINDGQGFKHGLESALLAGKPIVLVKSGRTQSGQKAAATHTAAVSGSDRVFQAVCEQFGATLVEDVQPMLHLLKIQLTFGNRLADFKRFMVVTQSGGMGSLAADCLEREGLQLAEISPGLNRSLKHVPHLAAVTHWHNPADVRGTSLRGDATMQTLLPFFEDERSDLVLLLLARTTIQEQDHETAQAIIVAAQKTKKPLLVVWVGQHLNSSDQANSSAIQLLTQANIPVFDQVSDAVKALSEACRYWQYRSRYLLHYAEEEARL
ncbi:MAG: CoA-binding protein [Anaerolineaceae bacterium]|nr:CoA-binding protein [Anaerolineaceae bacterium]